jgi:hypothetical protein
VYKRGLRVEDGECRGLVTHLTNRGGTMKRFSAWVCSALFLFAGYANAQLINFDDVPDGTDIRTHYAGVTFSCAGQHCPSPPAVLARQTAGAPSAPNTVSLVPGPASPGVHNPTTGTIMIVSACLAKSVSVKAKSTQVVEPLNLVQHAILVAENPSGTEVGQATGTQFGVFETLTVDSPSNLIKTIRLGVENTGVAGVAQFDDLSIDCAPFLRPWHWWIFFGVLFVGVVVFIFWRVRPKP